MKIVSVLALTFAVAPVIGAPAIADSVGSCAELTDPQSPNFDADRDTWWRFTDERGISCAQGDISMSEDSAGTSDAGTSDDEGDDAASSPSNGGARDSDGLTGRAATRP